MIHMLSKFDLKPGADLEAFKTSYANFGEAARQLGLVEQTGPVGKRVKNTPMDTAGDSEPEYYSIMSFKDRAQLDASYAHFLGAAAEDDEQQLHHQIHEMVVNSVFTCWEE